MALIRALALALSATMLLSATAPRQAAFDLVPLGTSGGVEEPTSAYHITARGASAGVLCDAGTLASGIALARRNGAYPHDRSDGAVLASIRAYLVTHAHLDHVAGLVLVSPSDTKKPIFALPQVNEALAVHYFNWSVWPNMGDRGTAPRLGLYAYRDLDPGGAPVPIDGTGLTVSAYPLSHGGVLSTAFLLRAGQDAFLCMGDTGPDEVERSTRLARLWKDIAPLVKDRRLRGIIIEASYPDPVAQTALYGHLTPKWLAAEMEKLRTFVGDDAAMRRLPILVTHIKPSMDAPEANEKAVERQLRAFSGLTFTRLRAGRKYAF